MIAINQSLQKQYGANDYKVGSVFQYGRSGSLASEIFNVILSKEDADLADEINNYLF